MKGNMVDTGLLLLIYEMTNGGTRGVSRSDIERRHRGSDFDAALAGLFKANYVSRQSRTGHIMMTVQGMRYVEKLGPRATSSG